MNETLLRRALGCLVSVILAGCGSTAKNHATGSPTPTSVGSTAEPAASASASATAAEPVECKFGSLGGGWAGAHPYWSLEGAAGGVLFGELEGKTAVHAGPFVDGGSFLGMAVLANGWVLVPATGGTRVLFAGADRLLPDTGRGTISPKGDLLAIASGSALALYDVATWKRRWTTPLEQSGESTQFTSDGKYVVDLGQDGSGATVIDLATGAVILATANPAAISPAGKLLASLQMSDEGKWSIRVVTLGSKLTPREIPIEMFPTSGYLDVLWSGETRVDVVLVQPAAMMHFGTHSTLASIDVASGRPLHNAAPLMPEDDGRESEEALAKLKSAAGFLLPTGRSFVGGTLHTVPFLGPTASGFVAAQTSTTANSEFMTATDGALFIADTRKKKVLSTAPLPESFGVQFMHATADERFVLACGNGTFIVDTATGRTALRPDLTDCWSEILHDDWIWTPEGLLDLTSDEANPGWPLLVPGPDPKPACDAASKSR